MRQSLILAALASLPLVVSCANSSEARSNSGENGDRAVREYRFTYETTVPAQPGTEKLAIWVPLPLEDPGVQEVRDLQISAPAGYRQTREDVYGNRMIYCEAPDPSKPTKVSWTAKIRRVEDTGQGTKPTSERYLQANRLIPVDGPAREQASKLGVTDDSMALQVRAKKIYDDVLGGMQYDKNHEGWGQGSFEHAMTVCKGNCTDFHSRFIGVGRAAGIPVRFTMGIPMKPKAKGEYNSYHCWAHYYDGKNWHPVDISEADKVVDKDPAKAEWFFGHLDPNRLSLTYGRDLWLEPKQEGDVLNYFVFPYAEADGQKVKMGKPDWLFTYENL